MRFTLPIKIALLAFIVTVAGIGSVSWFGYQDTASLLRKQSLADISYAVSRETGILARTLKEVREDISFLAEAPPILGLIRAINGKGYDDQENMTSRLWRKRLEGLFATIMRQKKLYFQIRFIGLADNGREIVRVDRHNGAIRVTAASDLQQKSHRPYFQEASRLKPGEVYFSETNLNYEHGKPTLPNIITLRVAIPVFSKAQRPFGVVIINIDFGSISRNLFAKAPEKIHFFIATQDGKYLFNDDKEKIFLFNQEDKATHLNEDFPKVDFYTKGHPDNILPGVTVGVPIIETSEENGIVFQHLHFDYLNKKRFYIIGAAVSHDVINAGAVDFGERLLTLLIVTAVILGFIILFVTSAITAPIRGLIKSVQSIAKGEENVTFPVSGQDEVGILTRSISAMYEHLGESRNNFQKLAKSLESMVEQRTRQLTYEIEERKQAEIETKSSEEFLRAITSAAQDAIISMDGNGNITFVNDAGLKMFGFSHDELIGAQLHKILVPGRYYNDFEKGFEKFKKTGKGRIIGKTVELSILRKDGTEVLTDHSFSSVNLHGEWHSVSVIRDTTERRKAEEILRESESRFRRLFEKAPLGYQSLNVDGKFIEVNQAWLEMLGYSRDEVIGHPFEDFIVEEGFVKNTLPHFKEKGEIQITGTEMRCRDGSLKTIHIEGRIGYDKKGNVLQTHCILTDITESTRAEEKIKTSLKEKEVLLQEIHHRVKNNLQVVSSLLSLQAGAEKNTDIIDALNESERRIRVMARVHENLYRAGDLAHVNAMEYLNAIAKDAKMSHADSASGIAILEDVDDITMDIERAIPIGQIVSELISNSFKHAFPDTGEGTVTISLKRRGDNEIELVVSDDGTGLPDGYEFENSATLGLKLVTSLAANLDGKITVDTSRGDTSSGTRVGIIFAGGGG